MSVPGGIRSGEEITRWRFFTASGDGARAGNGDLRVHRRVGVETGSGVPGLTLDGLVDVTPLGSVRHGRRLDGGPADPVVPAPPEDRSGDGARKPGQGGCGGPTTDSNGLMRVRSAR